MNLMNRGRDILQRREASGDGGGGGGGGGAAWYEGLEGVKDNAPLVESLKGFKTPGEAFTSMSRGFGDQWREAAVAHLPEADRPAALEWANRYKTPKDFFDGARQAHTRARTNEARTPPGEKATPEEIAAFRQASGIPEKPDGYFEKLPNGLVIGEDDKEIVASFAEELHKQHAPPSVVHAALGWYNKFQEQTLSDRKAADSEDRQAAEDALRMEFSGDYRANMSAVKTYLDGLPDEVGSVIAGARGPDGRALMNTPEFVRAIAGIARELLPGGTLMGATAAAGGAQIDTEIAAIEKTMRENRKSYDKDPKMRQRYQDLLDAKIRRDARKSGARAA